MEPEKKIDFLHFREKFIEEATDQLNGLDGLLMKLESNPTNLDIINQVFRVMHTLKGSSGMFGFTSITEITHDLENIYDSVRNGSRLINTTIINLTFAVADHVRNLLADYDFTKKENQSNQISLLSDIKNSTNTDNAGQEKPKAPIIKPPKFGLKTFQILFNPDETIIQRAINLSITFHDLFELGEYHIHAPSKYSKSTNWAIFLITEASYDDIEDSLMFVMDYCKISMVADFDIFAEENLEEREKKLVELESERKIIESMPVIEQSRQNIGGGGATIRLDASPVKNIKKIYVESSKLDHLMYLVSELVTAKSELLIAISEGSDKTQEAAEKIDKLTKLFSDSALNIRLVSLHDMITKFQRLIRDLSIQLGKKIEFVTIGSDTELDKNIIDVIAEPIMHILRNCIDHGVELPEKRIEQGKPETGTIKLHAYKNGNNVHVEISDDGNGINEEYVYQKAVDKGFITPNALLSKKEKLELIFLPGFSTANSLTEVSGRGVGMDVVLKKIHEIRGEVSIDSEAKIGTTFRLKLQQTISIIETLLVVSENSKYAIPIEDVEICGMEAYANILERQSNLLDFNSELIPYFSLRDQFHPLNPHFDNEKIVIIKRQNIRYAILADQIIGEFQAVVKPLGSCFEAQNFLSGASVYGDGSMVLLLDTEKLKDLITTTSKQ